MMSNDELSELRARFLGLDESGLTLIHGWLIGVACAVERVRDVPHEHMDKLIAELRESSGPDRLPEQCRVCKSKRLRHAEKGRIVESVCRSCMTVERTIL